MFFANTFGLTGVGLSLVGLAPQWVFGIAFWIYPAWGSERTAPRFTRVMNGCWLLLNTGTLVRAIGEGSKDLALRIDWMHSVFGVGALAGSDRPGCPPGVPEPVGPLRMLTAPW